VITLDTSAVYAMLSRADPGHGRIRAAALADRGPHLIPVGSLGELAYLIESNLPPAALTAFLRDLREGNFTLDCGEQDLARIQHLVQRYADLPLGFVDAAVIACAERHGGRVLTLDLRHFGVVAREGTITILP
jgi:predicted nucleic acid-binding protein